MSNDQVMRARQLKLIRARRLQAFGGLALACSFFLPAVKGCSGPEVPAENAVRLLEGATDMRSVVEWEFLFLSVVAAYLFGLITLLIAVRFHRLSPTDQAMRGRSVATFSGVILLMFLPSILYRLVDCFQRPNWPSTCHFVFCAIWLFSCLHWWRSIRSGAGGLLALRWHAAICCTAWFALFFIAGDSLYGLWISLGGSILIAIGCFLEAKARSSTGAWATLGQLAVGRITIFNVDRRQCIHCGYLLVGLVNPRCPECGSTFDWKEHDLQPVRPPSLADQPDRVDANG